MPDESKNALLFRLELEVGRADLQWRLYAVQDGGDVRLDGDRDPCEALLSEGPVRTTIRLLVTLQRWLGDALVGHQLPKEEQDKLEIDLNEIPQILGQNLYNALFPEQVRRIIDAKLVEVRKAAGMLRIQLQFGDQETELSSWPWEYLYVPDQPDHSFRGQFLATLAELSLSRRLELKTVDALRLFTADPVRVLLVCASPIAGGVIFNTVLTKVTELRTNKRIQLVKLLDDPPLTAPLGRDPHVLWKHFVKLVKVFQPHVIHYIGHGKLEQRHGQLAFVDRAGGYDWKPGGDFALAAAASRDLKLVFLQACESASPDPHLPMSDVARSCAKVNIPAVVAMQAKIENQLAGKFACSFYDVLAKGLPVDYAVAQGRQAIKDELKARPSAFGVPVLYLRSFDGLMAAPKTHEKDRAAVIIQPVAPPTQRFCPQCWEPAFAKDQVYCPDCNIPLACGKCGKFFESPPATKKPLKRCIYCSELIAIAVETPAGDSLGVSGGTGPRLGSPGGLAARPPGADSAVTPQTAPPAGSQDALRLRTSQRPPGDSNPNQFQKVDPPPPKPPAP